MPIYEYKCARCGEVFQELVRSSSDEKPLKCPKCGCKKSEKLFSVFAAQGNSSKSASGSSGGAGCAGCRSTNCSTCGR